MEDFPAFITGVIQSNISTDDEQTHDFFAGNMSAG